jgi:predicted glycoside hydrolase/deacetylase ChbG (UPF0249 family)
MMPNPVLRKLGFDNDDRVVILHADDVGMCQATIPAMADLVDFGLLSSYAVMVPCPWFPETAAYCRRQPEVDMGVHSTLTSEWDSYRWGPISSRDPAAGLLDVEGYFYHLSEQVQVHGQTAAVQAELQAQVERALAAGIDVSHIDTHMGAVASPQFIPGYVQLAMEYRLPAMVPRLDEAGWIAQGLDRETADFATQFITQLESLGLPLLDAIEGLPLDQPEDRLGQAKRAIDSLEPGLTHLLIHPAQDTLELRAITPTTWQCRVADYQTFTDERLRSHIQQAGIQVIGYKALRDLMRQETE